MRRLTLLSTQPRLCGRAERRVPSRAVDPQLRGRDRGFEREAEGRGEPHRSETLER